MNKLLSIAVTLAAIASQARADTVTSVYYDPDPRLLSAALALVNSASNSLLISAPRYGSIPLQQALAAAQARGVYVGLVLATAGSSEPGWQYSAAAAIPSLPVYLSKYPNYITNNFIVADGANTWLGSHRWRSAAVETGNWGLTVSGTGAANTYSQTWGSLAAAGTVGKPAAVPIIGSIFIVQPFSLTHNWYAAQYTCTATGPCNELLIPTGTNTSYAKGQSFTAGIYADSSGTPGALLATSATCTTAGYNSPIIATFPTPATLTNTNVYWLALSSGSNSVLNQWYWPAGKNYAYALSYTYTAGVMPSNASIVSPTTGNSNWPLTISGYTGTVSLKKTVPESADRKTLITGASVTPYFCPGTDCQTAAVALINSATSSIYLGAYSFTNTPIEQALAAAIQRGVQVKAILDISQSSSTASLGRLLAVQGAQVLIDTVHPIYHNKIIITDSATVALGSYNFSGQAQANAENFCVINSPALAAIYLTDWQYHAGHSKPIPPQLRTTPAPPQSTCINGRCGNNSYGPTPLPGLDLLVPDSEAAEDDAARVASPPGVARSFRPVARPHFRRFRR